MNQSFPFKPVAAVALPFLAKPSYGSNDRVVIMRGLVGGRPMLCTSVSHTAGGWLLLPNGLHWVLVVLVPWGHRGHGSKAQIWATKTMNGTKMIVEGKTYFNQMMVEGCRRYHIFGFDLQKRDATGLKPGVSAWDCVSANGMHTGSRTQIQIATSWS